MFPDRDPLKRWRDALQADAGEWILHERLPYLLENNAQMTPSPPYYLHEQLLK